MQTYVKKNKEAWEFDAYNFWIKQAGTPAERAKRDVENPLAMLRRFATYFEAFDGVKIANICGSSGKRAIPLALLGAKVTVFDISEANKRYACEVAAEANAHLDYIVGDVMTIDMAIYKEQFDVVFMEGGVLHYFHELDEFMLKMHGLLKPGGKLICSDFHPLTKIMDVLNLEQATGSYFSDAVFEGEMAHARFYPDEIRAQIPKCSYRKYTLSEIINAVLHNRFSLKQFDEHPSWENKDLPGEFTLVAIKENVK